MTGARLPAPQPGPSTPEQVWGQDEIAAAKRRLGEMFKAWRLRAGLTQPELAARTGYKRAGIQNAERGTSRARALFSAADKATGAAGALLAERDQADAFIISVQQEAARRARAALAQQAGASAGTSAPEPDALAFLTLRCPSCATPLPATLGIHVALTLPSGEARSPEE